MCLCNPRSEFLVSSDMNINYLNENNLKETTEAIIKMYLSHTVNFVTVTQNISSITTNNFL
jgi:hypothetical protein